MQTHFFTGFPGFIATELIKEISKQEQVRKFYFLVQEEQLQNAQVLAQSILGNEDTSIEFECIPGDIVKNDLGLDPEIVEQLRKETLTVWHLAAIYDLAVQKEIAWAVNVKGTDHVNQFVRQHPSIHRYIYFSTAYVAGKREGLLLETELIRPPAFKNHYEETKFEAEVLVEALKDEVPLTIIRPGIVRGHSITGETNKFDGPYFFMNMIDRLKWLPLIPYVGKSTAEINVVPIDYIVKASIFLSNLKGAAGQTIHLTDPSPYPVEEVYSAMVQELTGKKPKGRLPRPIAEKSLSSKKLQRKLGVEAETLDYLTWQGTFDTTIASKLLEESGIQCADFLQSIPAMASFYNEHKTNRKFHIQIK